jgi:error-prone DNA polymerase
MSEADGKAVLAARAARPFHDLDDFVRRTGLDRRALERIAEAGGFESLERSRRESLWSLGGMVRTAEDLVPVVETHPSFASLGPLEKVFWDHRASEHSARGHPLLHLRAELRAQGLPSAREVAKLPDGAWVSYAGLVICRQRPGTASGVVFMTLEDETGFVNVVVWPAVFESEENLMLIRTTSFLGVSGGVQSKDGVVHIIARKFWKAAASVSEIPEVESRNFH